jgi:hypothetical protein
MSWRTANSLVRLREQINAMAPDRSRASDGTIGDSAHASRDSDHNPWVRLGKIGIVTAMDITHDPADGCDAEAIVNKLIESRDARIKYIIWRRRIISSIVQPWVWRGYTKKNPHERHFHLSVHPDQVRFDSVEDWKIR